MMGRGGRRPGAGAPKGNTNALQTGAFARRTRDALKLIHAIPTLKAYYRMLRDQPGPNVLQKQRNLIDAAQHVIDTHPHLAHELEALIEASLEFRLHEIARFRYILADLARPPLTGRHLERALKHTAWLARTNLPLLILLTNHVHADLEPKLASLARKTIKQSSPNREAQKEGPPSPEALAARSLSSEASPQ